jgi:hypothetical protein
MFANALQDRYSLKKSNTSASLGVGVLGSVSMPIGSSDDSMVKVASETVTAAQFYDRYFALVESYLPKPKKTTKAKAKVEPEAPAAKVEKPAVDLGLPEQAAAAPVAAPVTPAAEPTPAPPAAIAPANEVPAAPVANDSQGSQPVAPPAEPAPIQVQQEAQPAEPAPAAL